MTLLRVNQLTKNFGGLCAVSNVSMNIEEGELIGLIGPNGAGKTTFFNLLTGVYEPSDGTIELNINGKMTSIGGLKPYRITQMGLARTFQNIRLFKSMSALDNVKVAMHKDIHYGSIAAILRLPSYYKEEERVQKEAEELLKVVGLYEKRNERAEQSSVWRTAPSGNRQGIGGQTENSVPGRTGSRHESAGNGRPDAADPSDQE